MPRRLSGKIINLLMLHLGKQAGWHFFFAFFLYKSQNAICKYLTSISKNTMSDIYQCFFPNLSVRVWLSCMKINGKFYFPEFWKYALWLNFWTPALSHICNTGKRRSLFPQRLQGDWKKGLLLKAYTFMLIHFVMVCAKPLWPQIAMKQKNHAFSMQGMQCLSQTTYNQLCFKTNNVFPATEQLKSILHKKLTLFFSALRKLIKAHTTM